MTHSRRAFVLGGAAVCATPLAAHAQTHPTFPFASTYRQDSRLLVFVAAAHSADPASRTHHLVNQAFDQGSFALAIVEGVPTSLGASPNSVRADLEAPGPSGAGWSNGESALAARRAIAANIPFMGGEPDQTQLNTALLAEGFTQADILSTLLLRRLPQMLRTGLVTGANDPRLTAALERMLAQDRRTLTPPDAFTLDDFHAWYRAQYGNDFVAETDVPRRLNEPNTRFTAAQQHMSTLRDAHLLRLIGARLDIDRAIITVYGASHYAALQERLAALMGPPSFT